MQNLKARREKPRKAYPRNLDFFLFFFFSRFSLFSLLLAVQGRADIKIGYLAARIVIFQEHLAKEPTMGAVETSLRGPSWDNYYWVM